MGLGGTYLPDEKKTIAVRFLCCSRLIEEEILQTYQNLSQKMPYVDIQSLLIGFAYDSLKHSKMLQEIGNHIQGPELQRVDCRETMRQLWQKVDDLNENLSNRVMDAENLPLLVKGLADLENSLSEEYSILLKFENLQYIVDEISLSARVDSETLERVFSIIVKDKENHRNLLIDILYRLSVREMEKAGDNTPVTKYQNPDKWNETLGPLV